MFWDWQNLPWWHHTPELVPSCKWQRRRATLQESTDVEGFANKQTSSSARISNFSPSPKLAVLFIYMLIGRQRWAGGSSKHLGLHLYKKNKMGPINDTLYWTFFSASVCRRRHNEAAGSGSEPRDVSAHNPPPDTTTSKTPLITTSSKAAHLVKHLSPPITSTSIASLITLIQGQRGPLVFTRTHRVSWAVAEPKIFLRWLARLHSWVFFLFSHRIQVGHKGRMLMPHLSIHTHIHWPMGAAVMQGAACPIGPKDTMKGQEGAEFEPSTLWSLDNQLYLLSYSHRMFCINGHAPLITTGRWLQRLPNIR